MYTQEPLPQYEGKRCSWCSENSMYTMYTTHFAFMILDCSPYKPPQYHGMQAGFALGKKPHQGLCTLLLKWPKWFACSGRRPSPHLYPFMKAGQQT